MKKRDQKFLDAARVMDAVRLIHGHMVAWRQADDEAGLHVRAGDAAIKLTEALISGEREMGGHDDIRKAPRTRLTMNWDFNSRIGKQRGRRCG